MSDPVRIAMLGSGFVAEFYMQGLANVNGQRVVVNFFRSADRSADFARRWGIPEHSTDLDAVIGGWDADLFVIALPNEVHFPAALALANAKRNQVCTKPLGRTRQEARKILDAARESGAMHGYAETEVFAPAVVKARESIERGGIGRVLWVRSRESHSGPHSPHFWDVEKTGGGALHELESLGIAHCELSWTTLGGLDLRNEIHGSEGSIFTDVTRQTPIASFTTKSAGYVVEKADIDFGWTRALPEEAFAYGYQAEMRHFVECVRDRKTPRETYDDGYVVNCILDAGYESMRMHKWVAVES